MISLPIIKCNNTLNVLFKNIWIVIHTFVISSFKHLGTDQNENREQHWEHVLANLLMLTDAKEGPTGLLGFWFQVCLAKFILDHVLLSLQNVQFLSVKF